MNWPVERLAHGQEQIKDLFHLLRILEVGIIEYKSFQGNSFACLCYMLLLACCRCSSGQSLWLQIQRSRVRFPARPDFLSSSGSGTGSIQPREVN